MISDAERSCRKQGPAAGCQPGPRDPLSSALQGNRDGSVNNQIAARQVNGSRMAGCEIHRSLSLGPCPALSADNESLQEISDDFLKIRTRQNWNDGWYVNPLIFS
jgi:hypothetical protein